ncbi:General transcription factor II-I repeat domain-containing protein 2 [Merluccius polli]|uniref:General transcription factor II-I repeat domain-containing protein 2 n=1 Tax=Merluccius polli TaxID=89951 RepID=A0AA47N4I0_MERPO|nr:General transcription factor II-I repeat domain-containing protein 2 [Merluccius polli]
MDDSSLKNQTVSVRAAEKIVGAPLPSLQDIYNTRLSRKEFSIAGDSTHPTHCLFSLLPSGRRMRSLKARTSRLKDSFVHQAAQRSGIGYLALHLGSVATDGALSTTGAHKSFVALLQKSLGRTLVTFHCILHQEALCAQTFPLECTEVMNVVIQIVNKIMANGLNHRQFCLLLDDVESTHSDLPLHNRVWWLSRREGSPFLSWNSQEWLEKLHFMVDMTAHLNTLNTTLRGKGGTALHMLEEVLTFERKLTVFARDLQRGTLSHFPSLREFKQDHNLINVEYLQSAITAMQTSFWKRFCDFRD